MAATKGRENAAADRIDAAAYHFLFLLKFLRNY